MQTSPTILPPYYIKIKISIEEYKNNSIVVRVFYIPKIHRDEDFVIPFCTYQMYCGTCHQVVRTISKEVYNCIHCIYDESPDGITKQILKTNINRFRRIRRNLICINHRIIEYDDGSVLIEKIFQKR